MGQRVSGKVIVEVSTELSHLIPNFLKNREKDVESLRAAVASKDFAAAEHLGHNLYGCAESYGFSSLGRIGLALENAAQAKDEAKIGALTEELSSELGRTEVRFK